MNLQQMSATIAARRGALPDLYGIIARGAASAFLIQATGLVLKYVSQVALARWMSSVSEYASFAVTFTWIQILAVGAALGFTTSALRFVPEYLTRSQAGHLQGFLRRSRQLVLSAGAGIALLGTLVLLLADGRSGSSFTYQLGLWIVPLYALSELQMQSIRGMRRVGAAFTPSFIIQPLLLIIMAFTWWQWAGELTSSAATMVLALSIVGVLLLQRRFMNHALSQYPRSATSAYDTERWIRVSIPLLVSAGCLMIMANTDVILLGLMRGDGEAGVYFAASRTARQAAFMLAAVNAIVAPLISAQIAEGDRDKLQRLVHFSVAMVFVPSLFVAIILLSLNQWVLGLFGPEYLAGRDVLFVLVIGQLVNALTGPVGFLLSLGGHERRSTTVYVWCTLLNVILNALFIRAFGMTGAAWASSLSLAIANLWLAAIVVRRMGIVPFPVISLSRGEQVRP